MMTSLDVESHFTNIPLQETIDLCVELLLNDKPSIDGFTKLIFTSYLQLLYLNH